MQDPFERELYTSEPMICACRKSHILHCQLGWYVVCIGFANANPILADIQKTFAHCCSMLVVVQKQASRKSDKSLGV